MRFIGTKRFSPVVCGGDVPMSTDLYFIDPLIVPKKKDEFIAFKRNNGIVIDDAWWWKQRERCINGFSVENAIEDGGDALVEGWNVNLLENGDRYIPDLGITIHGTTVSITPRHYFYLNFWWIKGYNPEKKRKTIIHPRFTDLSWKLWHIRDRMIEEEKNNLWGKCRQRGLSEEEACDTAYEFLFYPDSQSAILGGDDFYSANTMKMVKRGLDRIRNTQFYKWRSSNSADYMKAEIFGSEVYSRTCKTNTQAASSLTPTKAKFEEIGIWKKGFVKEAYEFVQPSQEAEGYKTGWSQFIGTGGEMDEGVDDMQEMFYDPASFNMLEFIDYYENGNVPICCFVPAWMFEILDEEGNSLRKESIERIEKIRKRKSASARLRYITQKPLIPSEIFYIGKGGFFGETIRQWCNERIAYIKTHREAQVEMAHRLEWIDPGNLYAGVRAIPDADDGWCYIIEHPETYEHTDEFGYKSKKAYENLNKVATDSYDQDEAHTSSSKGACTVKKGFLDANHTYHKYIAYCLERPETSKGGADLFFEHTALMTMYWNGINLIEFSKIRIIDWYKKKGLTGLLKLRPQLAIAKMVMDSKTQNTYGIDPATKPDWLKMQRDFLSKRENIENCDSITLLSAWAKFRYDPSGKKYNCDITIATSLNTVLMDDEQEIMVQRQNEEMNNMEPIGHYFTRENEGICAHY